MAAKDPPTRENVTEIRLGEAPNEKTPEIPLRGFAPARYVGQTVLETLRTRPRTNIGASAARPRSEECSGGNDCPDHDRKPQVLSKRTSLRARVLRLEGDSKVAARSRDRRFRHVCGRRADIQAAHAGLRGLAANAVIVLDAPTHPMIANAPV